MTPALLIDVALDPALRLLPPKMDSLGARAMLVAIALQESDQLKHRKQMRNGPARGLWQFERGGGVRGVLTHQASAGHAKRVCAELVVAATAPTVHEAITYNDVLACVFARLLLWAVPGVLPKPDESEKGYAQYIAGWRPGKPHPSKWPANFVEAWDSVNGEDA